MKITKREKRDAKQLYVACLVNGRLDENRVQQVVQRVIAAGERDCQPILAYFLRLVKLDYSAAHGHHTERHRVTGRLQTIVQTDLAQRYGPGLTTNFVQRPELIGGMRIQVGCDVYDGSVRAGAGSAGKKLLIEGNYGKADRRN